MDLLAHPRFGLPLGSTNPNWQVVAWYTLVGGILGALIAAVPGFIDMSINLTVVALYVVNAYIRKHSGGVSDAAIGLSVIAVLLLAVDPAPAEAETRERPI